jgi:hypothetical protein
MLILSILGFLLNAFLGVQGPLGGGYAAKLDGARAFEIVDTLD